jgi:hypothetical protein
MICSQTFFFKTNQILNEYFVSSFRYLGPLRYKEITYPISKLSDIKDVDTDGKYTASVIFACKDDEIEYLPSELFERGDGNFNKKTSTATFIDALNDWLHYLGVA